ncbi:hypothetical protein QYF36_021052 [Acer negundo]|nr:hypothetical protein QYF36_021052 [Acer negundo]
MLGNFSVDLGELLTLREGLLFAKRHNLVINSTEVINSAKVDVLSVASLLNYDVSFLGDALFIVLDIKAFVLMRGSSNSLAHALASLAFSSGEELFWWDVNHSYISPGL